MENFFFCGGPITQEGREVLGLGEEGALVCYFRLPPWGFLLLFLLFFLALA